MNEAIEKFDPSKLMDGVKERIKSTFVSLIPDEQWQQMIEKELYVFTTGRIQIKTHYENGKYVEYEERVPYRQQTDYNPNRFDNKDDISPLQQMIRDELREKFKQSISEALSGDEYQVLWDKNGKPRVSEAVQKTLTENAESVFVCFMSNMMQMAIDAMRSSIVSQLNDINRRY